MNQMSNSPAQRQRTLKPGFLNRYSIRRSVSAIYTAARKIDENFGTLQFASPIT